MPHHWRSVQFVSAQIYEINLFSYFLFRRSVAIRRISRLGLQPILPRDARAAQYCCCSSSVSQTSVDRVYVSGSDEANGHYCYNGWSNNAMKQEAQLPLTNRVMTGFPSRMDRAKWVLAFICFNFFPLIRVYFVFFCYVCLS